jgi:hypothetical protein
MGGRVKGMHEKVSFPTTAAKSMVCNQQQALAAAFKLHIPKPLEPEEWVKAIAALAVVPFWQSILWSDRLISSLDKRSE